MAKSFFIDEEECIACGSCAELCPNCFKFEEDMATAAVIGLDCPEELIQEAMDNCPAECIHWREQD